MHPLITGTEVVRLLSPSRPAAQPIDPPAALAADAFNALYADQAAAVWNYARYRLGPAEADDATAEVFTRAWAARASFRPSRGSPTVWLWAIARNTVTDAWRRLGRAADELPDSLPAASADPAETHRDRAGTQRALAALSDLDRELVALRFGAGHTNRAIANLLGLTEANVAQRLRRALLAMRRTIEEGR
jgi:RNA polymerase sigma-70 factor (ECF subfamily)